MKLLQLSIFVAVLSHASYASKVLEITNSWNTGFEGFYNIHVGKETENGWKIEVKFHERLANFKIWTAKLVTAEQGESGSRYVFVNYPYNKDLTVGEVYKAKFSANLVDSSGPRVPPMTVKFQHRVIYTDQNGLVNDVKTAVTTPSIYGNNRFTRPTTKTATKMSGAPTTKTSKPTQKTTISTFTTMSSTTTAKASSINEITVHTTEAQNKHTNESAKPAIVEMTAKADVEEEEIGSGDDNVTNNETKLKWKATETRYPYAIIIHKSLLFYEAQRSGRLPDDNRIEWRGDSAMNDIGQNGEDLTGGYYDAGDHVKFTFPMAFSMTALSWGLIEYWEAYEQAGEVENTLKAIKWGIDFILKSYVGRYELYGQVGNGEEDHEYWGRPEDMKMDRPAYKITEDKPGSDLAAECSAALSAASLAFERSDIDPYADPEYISLLREKAESLYEFADTRRGLYHKSITDATKFYRSHGFKDELLWARVWLYRSTGDNEHLQKAETLYTKEKMFLMPASMMFSWDDKTVGIQTLIAQVTGGEKRNKYLQKAINFCRRLRRERFRFTKKGLLYLNDWSPLRYAANVAFICQMVADEGVDWSSNSLFARRQIHYMLGDSGRSYLVGFGENYPLSPHHRSSSCDGPGCSKAALESKKPNPHILHGALVGGPNRIDIFLDNRKDYQKNEVALDHNACFQGVIAALLQRSLIGVSPIKNRSHEPWYQDYLNYTAMARTETPATTSSVREPKSIFNFFGLYIVIAIALYQCYFKE